LSPSVVAGTPSNPGFPAADASCLRRVPRSACRCGVSAIAGTGGWGFSGLLALIARVQVSARPAPTGSVWVRRRTAHPLCANVVPPHSGPHDQTPFPRAGRSPPMLPHLGPRTKKQTKRATVGGLSGHATRGSVRRIRACPSIVYRLASGAGGDAPARNIARARAQSAPEPACTKGAGESKTPMSLSAQASRS